MRPSSDSTHLRLWRKSDADNLQLVTLMNLKEEMTMGLLPKHTVKTPWSRSSREHHDDDDMEPDHGPIPDHGQEAHIMDKLDEWIPSKNRFQIRFGLCFGAETLKKGRV